MDQQGAAGRVGAGQPGEHVAPARRAGLDVGGLVADLLELLDDPARAQLPHLWWSRVPGVGGVEPDQGADEVDDLVDGAVGLRVTLPSPFLPRCLPTLRAGLGSGAGIR